MIPVVGRISAPHHNEDVDGLAQDCNNSFAIALELLQSRIKPSVYTIYILLCFLFGLVLTDINLGLPDWHCVIHRSA